MTFNQIKQWARRFCRGEAIPVFKKNSVNQKINKHIKRIDAAKTFRRSEPPSD